MTTNHIKRREEPTHELLCTLHIPHATGNVQHNCSAISIVTKLYKTYWANHGPAINKPVKEILYTGKL